MTEDDDGTKLYAIEKSVLSLSWIATSAPINCLLCGEGISGMGGPWSALCEKCGDAIASGDLRGLFVWNENGDRLRIADPKGTKNE